MAIDKSRSRANNRPFYTVDQSAVFEAGMIAALAASPAGSGTVATLAGSADVPLGIFWNSKTTLEQKTAVDEPVTFDTDIKTLQHALLDAGTVQVTSEDGLTVFTDGVDYTVNLTNGVITRLGGGAITGGDTVLVTYRFQIPQNELQFFGVGIDRIPDDTIGSGKITVVEGFSQLWIDVFDTQTTYNLGDSLGSDANGIITNNSPVSVFAKVISVPTAADPWLGIETTTAVE